MTRRGLALVLLVVVLVAGLVADRVVGRPTVAQAQGIGPDLPSQAPEGALSSTWFCPAAAADNGPADGRIVITNPTTENLTGTVTVVPSQGHSKDAAVQVLPRRRSVVRLGDEVPSPYAAALIQLDGPSGSVEEQIRGGLGESVSPCARRASDHWYFASGTTNPDARMLLSMFNPFPGDAVVDFTFVTDTGPFTPADLQGLVVPGRGVAVVDLGDHVRRRQVISSTISVRSGRVVAGKIQLRGAGGSQPAGATLTLGVLAPGTQWYFPDGVATTGVDERYEVYNPTDREADVQIALVLDQGSADPFTFTVAGHDRLTLVVNNESRIPRGVAHAGIVTSTNQVPVVVERVITAVAPSPRVGISDLTGAPRADRHWLFGVGAANSAQDEWLVAFNPGPATARLSVTAMIDGQPLAVDGLQDVELPAGQRVAMRLGDHLSQGNLVASVDASAPVVVERDLYRVGGVGMSAALGVVGP